MITKKAYAKINLGIRILRKREDGYHDLETIFHRVNIFDTLTFETSPAVSFSTSDPSIPNDQTNLCMKAAALIREKHHVTDGVTIYLQKQIPVGAGLGGGSSDAAATLLGLNSLWNLSLPLPELQHLAASLGSDVPYFLQDGSAYATGRGEVLEYIPLSLPYWIVLVNPGIHVSTPWAYQQFKIKKEKVKKGYTRILEAMDKSSVPLIGLLPNDFEEVVFPHYPAIADVRGMIMQMGAVEARMSGSGSSVFGLFRSEESALKAMQMVGNEYRTFLTPPRFQPDTV